MSHGSTFQPNDLAMVAGLATLHELESAELVERSAGWANCCSSARSRSSIATTSSRTCAGSASCGRSSWGSRTTGGKTTYRLLERMQPALFSQLVVVPLFTDHRVLSQVAGHGLNVIKGAAAARPLRGGRRLVRDGARRDARPAQKLPRATARFALRAARASVRS